MDTQRIKQHLASPTAAPLHQKLRDAIQAQISDGTLSPGDILPSERLLKEILNISRATIRQAVNTLIQDGFLQSIAGTGTFVLEQRDPPTMRHLIGLVTSSPNFNFFYPQLTAAFHERIREAGYGVVMALHNEQANTLDQIVNELLAQGVCALAITPPRYGDITPTIERLKQRNIPLVFVGRRVALQDVDSIATDNEAIGYQATRHLLELGHRHIAYIGLMDYSTGKERMEGYRRALDEAALPPYIVQLSEPEPALNRSSGVVPREHLAEPAQSVAHQIWGGLHQHSQPTAAFCFNDIVAMGVYKGLRSIGCRIPHDVSLISVDNLITVSHFEVPLTTFALPGEAIGIRSAETLLNRLLLNKFPTREVLLPATFVMGESTQALSG
jgi:DNA-binding LacI/PurR family transcriptional regulator